MAENKFVDASIIFIGIVVLAIVLKELQSVLRPLAIAIILTFLLLPLVRYCEKKRIPFIITFVAIILILVSSSIFLAYKLLKDSEHINSILTEQQARFENLFDLEKINGKLEEKGIEIVSTSKVSSFLTDVVKGLLRATRIFFAELFLVFIFTIFIISSWHHFIERAKEGMSTKSEQKFLATLEKIERGIRSYLVTKSMISFITACASALVMALFGVDFIIAFSALIFILNFIPNIGTPVAVGTVILSYALQVGFVPKWILLSFLLIMIQVLIDNFIDPKFSGQRLKLSPIIILLSLLIWGSLWGVMGMLIAVPLTKVLKIILWQFETTRKAAKLMN